MHPWEPVHLEAGACFHWEIGPLDLWIQRDERQLHLFVNMTSSQEGRFRVEDGATPPSSLEARRWSIRPGPTQLQLAPVLPDRPVIVRPRSTLIIPPGNEALFFVGLPVFVRVSLVERKSITLHEEPATILSKSWFGSSTEGELCYALRTRASQDMDSLNLRPHRVVSPLQIQNTSDSPLEFQRLCLRVEHLGIFQGQHHLWTNEGRVIYRGADQLSRIVHSRNAPSFDQADKQLAKARNPMKTGIVARTFGALKSFAEG